MGRFQQSEGGGEGNIFEPVFPNSLLTENLYAADADSVLAIRLRSDTPFTIGPEQVYEIPQRVWLPIPAGTGPGTVQLYYHPNGPGQGWYPAEQVEGWLVPDSTLYLEIDGTTYLGFLVRHTGIVQVGAP